MACIDLGVPIEGLQLDIWIAREDNLWKHKVILFQEKKVSMLEILNGKLVIQ